MLCQRSQKTSQNVSSEAQAENFFLFCRRIMLRSQDIQVFVCLNDISNR